MSSRYASILCLVGLSLGLVSVGRAGEPPSAGAGAGAGGGAGAAASPPASPAASPPASPAASAPASAAPEDAAVVKARELYNEARDLGRQRKYEDAHQRLLASLAVKKTWLNLAYLGFIELRLGRYREAAEHSAYAQKIFDDRAGEADKKQIAAQLAAAQEKVATVQLHGLADDARVLVDDRARDPSLPGDRVFLDPGPHQIEIQRSEHPPTRHSVDAEAGKSIDLDASAPRGRTTVDVGSSLVAVGASASAQTAANGSSKSAPTKPTSGAPGWSARTWVAVTGGGLTVLTLGLGTVMAVRARSLDNDGKNLANELESRRHNYCSVPSDDCTQIANRYANSDDATRWAQATFVTAGVLGAATLATWLLWPSRGRATEANRGYWISPTLGGSGTGMTMGGAF